MQTKLYTNILKAILLQSFFLIFSNASRLFASEFAPLQTGNKFAVALQSEMVFASKFDTNERFILASTGAGPCFIFAGYNAENGAGFLTHLYSASELQASGETIVTLFRQLLNPKKLGTTTFYLVGGFRGLSETTEQSVKAWLYQRAIRKDLGDVAQVYIDPKNFRWKILGSSLAIDVRDGHIQAYSSTMNLQEHPRYGLYHIAASVMHTTFCGLPIFSLCFEQGLKLVYYPHIQRKS